MKPGDEDLGPLSPQQAFNSVFELEKEMSDLATAAVARGSHRERQDAFARLAVAAVNAWPHRTPKSGRSRTQGLDPS